MAAVDPYSICPCGSGQKFKWCCHKVEAYADRAQRLLENGQSELAIQAIDEGLKKEPGNAWLLTRKALIQIRAHQPEAAKASIKKLLEKSPKHAGGLMLMTRLVLETEGPSAGAAQLQQALSSFPPERRKELAALVRLVGLFLSESHEFPAALKHLSLALTLHQDENDSAVHAAMRTIEGNASIPPWLRNDDALAPPPEGLAREPRERFEEALKWAANGLWSAAAAAFEMLSGDPVAGPVADRNLGFFRLWLADDAGAVAALRRYIATQGPTAEAVDIEALCQQLDPLRPDDIIEHVRLTWPIRDRARLLATLQTDPTVFTEGRGPLDPDDPKSPEVDFFSLLNRVGTEKVTPDLDVEDVPRRLGRVLVDNDVVLLDTFDDGRLDNLIDQFTALAGTSLPPAHPRTKVLGRVPRLELALLHEWLVPNDLDPEQARKLEQKQSAYLIREVWAQTPHRGLRGRTPIQSAQARDSEVPLRAALCHLEQQRGGALDFDFAGFRASLHVPLEPEIDPETVEVATLQLARLERVPADRLSDEKLVQLYIRSRRCSMDLARERAILAMIARPEMLAKHGINVVAPYTDMATIAASREQMAEAFEWIRRGRQAEPAAARARNSPSWDIVEIKLKATTEDPEQWVPELAVLLERYAGNHEASQTITMGLLDLGLIRMVPSPDRPGEILLDSRPLEALLSEYGPRVTTATGRLGVSASKPEIWTPGSKATGGGAGVWTPGSAAASPAPSGGKKLILPGT